MVEAGFLLQAGDADGFQETQVAEKELFLQAKLDAGHRPGNFAGDKGFATGGGNAAFIPAGKPPGLIISTRLRYMCT